MPKLQTLTYTIPIPPSLPLPTVIASLHNHEQMMSHNPLIQRHERLALPLPAHIPDNERSTYEWYKVTDKIEFVPGVAWAAREVSYEAGFCDVDDGVRTHVFAPMGVEIRGFWRLVEEEEEGGGGEEEGQEGMVHEGTAEGTGSGREGMISVGRERRRVVLKETTQVECSVLLAGFVKKNIDQSHQEGSERVLAHAAATVSTGVGNAPPNAF